MARDTDRKIISEALRLHGKDWNQGWDMPNDQHSHILTLTNYDTMDELVITYSTSGRITRLTHWVPVTQNADVVYASRSAIMNHKRDHVLRAIGAIK